MANVEILHLRFGFVRDPNGSLCLAHACRGIGRRTGGLSLRYAFRAGGLGIQTPLGHVIAVLRIVATCECRGLAARNPTGLLHCGTPLELQKTMGELGNAQNHALIAAPTIEIA